MIKTDNEKDRIENFEFCNYYDMELTLDAFELYSQVNKDSLFKLSINM